MSANRDLDDLIVVAGGALLFSSPVVFALQCFGWLRDGVWPAMPLRNYLPQPGETSWLGLDKIITNIWAMPLSAALLFATLVVGWLASLVMDRLDKRAREQIAKASEPPSPPKPPRFEINGSRGLSQSYIDYMDSLDKD